jgi:hypothetical protein
MILYECNIPSIITQQGYGFNCRTFLNFRETKDLRQALTDRARKEMGMTIDEFCRKCLGAFIELDPDILKALEHQANKM